MVSLENLLLSGLFLVLVQMASTVGMPRRGFSASECFVLGHWPFLFLNLVILYLTGGVDWTALNRFEPSVLFTAQMVVALGLLSFLLGGVLVVVLRVYDLPYFVRLDPGRVTGLRVGVMLIIVGLVAVVSNAVVMHFSGPDARSRALLILGHLLVPGVVICFQAAWDNAFSHRVRALGAIFSGLGIIALSFNWSRRPLLVALSGMVLIYFVRRRGVIDRRLLLIASPVLVALAVLGVLWRNALFYNAGLLGTSTFLGALEEYATELLWIESSAFSGLMLVVEANGLLAASHVGSLLLPFIFWIPRSLFPAKPVAFEASSYIGGAAYNIGPSLYGEVLVNVTIFGLVPFMILLGMILKFLDLSAYRSRLSNTAAAVYVTVLLDMVFLARGSFHNMFTPALLHLVIPLTLFELDRLVSAKVFGPRGSSLALSRSDD